jgi:sigma-B regulation protein RsbU (phosphoserine phosphatase)
MAEVIPQSSAEKLRRIQAVTDAALSQLGVEELLEELLDRTRDLLSADTAVVLLLDPSGAELVATAAKGLEDEVRQGFRISVGTGFAGSVAARRTPIAIKRVDATNVVNPILLGRGITSILGVPMIASGQLIGVLHIGSFTSRQFTDDDIELLQLVADRASLATQARLSQLDRAATLALQRSLLPVRLPTITGLDVAARYIPGADVGVGGDWYDLFRLPSGHIGIVIGDVAGSGLHAAVVMGRIRSALRAYALESDDPADVLTRLDRKVQVFEPDGMATVIYAVLDSDLGNLTLSNAGHPPPIIVTSEEPARLVEAKPAVPIGVYGDAARHNIRVLVPGGACLFFYTDGLVERHDRSIVDGMNQLAESLHCGPAETMCTTAMTQLFDGRPVNDDTAMLAIRLTSPGHQ